MIFECPSFWDWLYTFGEAALSKEHWEVLSEQGQYRNQTIVSEIEGAPYQWNFETLQFDFPITNRYGFTSLLILGERLGFEEVLYLRVGELYYRIGWYDAHNHEMVFRQEEFWQLIEAVKQMAPSIGVDARAYLLYLARFVPLLEDKTAITWMEKILVAYKGLCMLDKTLTYEVHQEERYTRPIGINQSKMVYRPHRIEAKECRLCFVIRTGLSWVKQPQGMYYLEGSGAYSIRTAIYDQGTPTPVDLYKVEESNDNYTFPVEDWQALLQQTSH